MVDRGYDNIASEDITFDAALLFFATLSAMLLRYYYAPDTPFLFLRCHYA